jgi:hypothetical protein
MGNTVLPTQNLRQNAEIFVWSVKAGRSKQNAAVQFGSSS